MAKTVAVKRVSYFGGGTNKGSGPGGTADTTKVNPPPGKSVTVRPTPTPKASSKPTPKPVSKPGAKASPHKTISQHYPLPKDVSPGRIDVSDVDRLNTYINRLKTATRRPLSSAATDAQKKRYADQTAALDKYTKRKSRYRVAIGDTAAARRKVNANSPKKGK